MTKIWIMVSISQIWLLGSNYARPKVILLSGAHCTKKTCKGLGRTAINNCLKFDQYKKCLMEGKIKRHHFSTICSSKHKLSTVRQRKKALLYFDSKRFLFACGSHLLPYNHYKIKKLYYSCPFCK
jgi:hypothetical protein